MSTRTHQTTNRHWAFEVQCPECGASKNHACLGPERIERVHSNGKPHQYKTRRMPQNIVHIERVLEMGHNAKYEELPIHRAKVVSPYQEVLEGAKA